MQSGRADRNRRRVGAAPTQRGDPVGLRIDALEAGYDGDLLALLEAVEQFSAIDVKNSRRGMGIAGLDRDLPALPGAGLNADRLQGNCKESRGDLLAGGHHRVIFAGVVHRRGFAAPVDQFIGLAGHRRDDDGDVVAGIDLALDVTGDVADAFDVGDGRAAEFHHEATHDDWFIPLRIINVARANVRRRRS
jgi:hypothetical protein